MRLIENVTKIKHRSFGIGLYKRRLTSSNAIVVEFSVGEKNLSMDAFGMGLISVVEEAPAPQIRTASVSTISPNINNMIQYDTAKTQIGGKNILEAYSSNKSLLFNESYTIVGIEMNADSIHACYNLTVVGDLRCKKIVVMGSLTVLGDMFVDEIVCQNTLLCQGTLSTISAEVGGDLIAESIAKCSKLSCGGNVIAQKTIDIEDSRVEKAMVAGEGIVGEGNFSSQYAIAVEYFEYDGDIEGKVIELDTDTSFGEKRTDTTSIEGVSYEYLLNSLEKAISEEIVSRGVEGEDEILDFAKNIATSNIANLSDWNEIFTQVIDISYLDEIDNLRDYLFLFYAQKILPREILEYETVEHIFKQPYEDAAILAADLPFSTRNISEFIMALKIITTYEDELQINKEEALDKMFQSIGIKYNTVKSFFVNK